MDRSATMRIVPRPRATAAGPPARRPWRWRALVVAAWLALTYAACDRVAGGPTGTSPPGSPGPQLRTGRVVGIADGDTIRVALDGVIERVRIIGLDTPEVDDANRTPACYGAEATAFADSMLEGRTVTLELDPTQDERDRFGRLLAHVRTADGLFATAAIAGGYGIHFVYREPSRHAAELQAAEDAARRDGAGLWSACAGRVDLPLASP